MPISPGREDTGQTHPDHNAATFRLKCLYIHTHKYICHVYIYIYIYICGQWLRVSGAAVTLHGRTIRGHGLITWDPKKGL